MINVARAGIILRQFLLNKITISQSVFYTSVDIVLCGSQSHQEILSGDIANLLHIKPCCPTREKLDQGRAGWIREKLQSEDCLKNSLQDAAAPNCYIKYTFVSRDNQTMHPQLKTPVGGLKSEMGTNRYYHYLTVDSGGVLTNI